MAISPQRSQGRGREVEDVAAKEREQRIDIEIFGRCLSHVIMYLLPVLLPLSHILTYAGVNFKELLPVLLNP